MLDSCRSSPTRISLAPASCACAVTMAMSLVSSIAASSTMTTVLPSQLVRPLLSANSSLWTVAAWPKPSPAMSCATALVGPEPITR